MNMKAINVGSQASIRIKALQGAFNDVLEKDVSQNMNVPPKDLKEAIAYAMLGKAKRVRPLIIYSIQEAVAPEMTVHQTALSAEYFHTSSLVIDDLPCMDNDLMRRDRKTLHLAFDEATALGVSYGLICMGFEKLHDAKRECEIFCLDASERLECALEITSKSAGFFGATLGQHLDVKHPPQNLEELLRIHELKTNTLFGFAFKLGWIFSGGSLSALNVVKDLAYSFGYAFQLADDLEDAEQDQVRQGDINATQFLSVQDIQQRINHHKEKALKLLKDLNLSSECLKHIICRI